MLIPQRTYGALTPTERGSVETALGLPRQVRPDIRWRGRAPAIHRRRQAGRL